MEIMFTFYARHDTWTLGFFSLQLFQRSSIFKDLVVYKYLHENIILCSFYLNPKFKALVGLPIYIEDGTRGWIALWAFRDWWYPGLLKCVADVHLTKSLHSISDDLFTTSVNVCLLIAWYTEQKFSLFTMSTIIT